MKLGRALALISGGLKEGVEEEAVEEEVKVLVAVDRIPVSGGREAKERGGDEGWEVTRIVSSRLESSPHILLFLRRLGVPVQLWFLKHVDL